MKEWRRCKNCGRELPPKQLTCFCGLSKEEEKKEREEAEEEKKETREKGKILLSEVEVGDICLDSKGKKFLVKEKREGLVKIKVLDNGRETVLDGEEHLVEKVDRGERVVIEKSVKSDELDMFLKHLRVGKRYILEGESGSLRIWKIKSGQFRADEKREGKPRGIERIGWSIDVVKDFIIKKIGKVKEVQEG